MTTKPPNGLAATGHPEGQAPDHGPEFEDLSDQIVVDPSQDLTVEASEDSTLEIEDEDTTGAGQTPPPTPGPLLASAETPPPSTAGFARRGAPTLLGVPLSSLPMPGVGSLLSGRREEHQPDVGEDDDEVTVMARPSVTDDDEEATKVEPAETAIRAAASKDEGDELTTALSTQASVERERALRKSMPPPSLDTPISAHSYRAGESGAEFVSSADIDDDADESLSDATPGISLDDDDRGTGSYSSEADDAASELEAVLAPRRPSGPMGGAPMAGSAFGSSFGGSTPLSRSDGFGGARLPTPASGLGLTLPPSPSLPPPAASPFSARVSPTGAPYPRTMSPAPTGPTPALQIPAPSGAVAMASTGGMFRNVQLPLGGLVASCLACLVGGLVIGGKFLGNRTAAAPAAQVAAAAPPPPPAPVAAAPAPAAPAPVIQAAPAPSQPVAAAPAHPAAAPAPAQPAAPAAAPAQPAAPAPAAQAQATDQALATSESATKRAARPAAPRKVASNSGTTPAPKPRKAVVAKGWVDPFAD